MIGFRKAVLGLSIAAIAAVASGAADAKMPRSLLGSVGKATGAAAGRAAAKMIMRSGSERQDSQIQSGSRAKIRTATRTVTVAPSPFISQGDNPQIRMILTKAERHFVMQDYDNSLKLLSGQTVQDHPHAKFLTGIHHEYGLATTRDDAKAAEHYEVAAAKGHAAAQYNLGLMYSDGRGVDRMPDRALLWIELAANQGLPDAQYALGLLYYNGKGAEQDLVVALKWFEVAAGYGHTSSEQNIAPLSKSMKKDDVVRARQLASIWRPSKRNPAAPR